MPVVTINREDAKQILTDAISNQPTVDDNISKKIIGVLNNTHKTYKYILVNGLLAKATNGDCDPIALQAGAEIDGAFDARSLCHSVLVPFERENLRNALGGSNEPFLNKPARFTHLSTDNAVRRGNDRNVLNDLISIFGGVADSESALEYLKVALYELNIIADAQEKLNTVDINTNPTYSEIVKFIDILLEKSFEGEVPVIVIATIESLLTQLIDNTIVVKPHKVNQSGASSKEVGDIDILKSDDLLYAIEVKDKDFTVQDIEHAAKKLIEGGGSKFQFVYGLNASADMNEAVKFITKYSEENSILISLISIKGYIHNSLMRIELENSKELVKKIMEIAVEINSKEETRKYIQEVIKKMGW